MTYQLQGEATFADPLFLAVLQDADTLAHSQIPVLLYGETGTGKEILARRIHAKSRRAGPFVAVNCGAISEFLAESELFGHEAGSFTGASGKREGWFEAAQGGTLFLDEIGDLPITLQVKLLRALQEREIVRIGSRKAIPLDVRIIAATSVDMAQAMKTGQFRRDLFYRLSGGILQLPRLRDRPLDILPLADHILFTLADSASQKVPRLTSRACEALTRHGWQGNIRELENVLRLAMIRRQWGDIDIEHLRLSTTESELVKGAGLSTASHGGSEPDEALERLRSAIRELFKHASRNLLDEIDRLIVNEAFEYVRFNQVHAANLLGISRSVLRTLLKRHGLLSADASSRPAVKSLELEGRESTPGTYSLERRTSCGMAKDWTKIN